MGFSTWHWLKKDIKMKFIATACLIAAAFAEPEAKADADASVLYGAYGYAGYAAPYSLGYRGYAGAYAGAYGAYPYGHSYGHYIGKRSADAEPEADASVLYGSYGYSGYAASPYALWHWRQWQRRLLAIKRFQITVQYGGDKEHNWWRSLDEKLHACSCANVHQLGNGRRRRKIRARWPGHAGQQLLRQFLHLFIQINQKNNLDIKKY